MVKTRKRPRHAAQKKATRAAYGATLAELADRGRARRGRGRRPDRLHHHQEARRRGIRRAPVQLRHRRAEHDRRGRGPLAGRATSPSRAPSPCSAPGRAYDQIRNTVCYSNLNVKIAPTHAGISVGPDGGTPPDARGRLPHARPSRHARARARRLRRRPRRPAPRRRHAGPRLRAHGPRRRCRASTTTGVELEIGPRLRAARGQRRHHRRHAAWRSARRSQAADALAARGHLRRGHRRVLASSPSMRRPSLASVGKTGCVVTAEEHSVIGGLGSAPWQSCLPKSVPRRLCVWMRGACDDAFRQVTASSSELPSAYFQSIGGVSRLHC